jgi:hypothetical protein
VTDDLIDVTLAVAAVLDRRGIPYTVGGSLASSLSGEPRASLDADVVVQTRVWTAVVERACWNRLGARAVPGPWQVARLGANPGDDRRSNTFEMSTTERITYPRPGKPPSPGRVVTPDAATPRGRDAAIALRPIRPDDRPLLLALYASTREAELALVDWDAAQKAAFVEMQFDAPGSRLTMTRV